MPDKPEILLPAGNLESYFAAIQAGADAIYLGLKQFNARGRAQNFSNAQFVSLCSEARKKGVKIYVTLNTLVKNQELDLLLGTLHFIKTAGADAIIIQDWGVFFIASRYFPELTIHASTQLGIHNSEGAEFLAELGFKRVVLARELLLDEVKQIAGKNIIETEVFVHGALCYSFSGMCLLSSYLGGRSANRGMCAQPCRREYTQKDSTKFLFNLKDNQSLEYVDQLSEAGVSSFKIEGRMKPGEYTYRVGKAYRLVVDNALNINQARQLLQLELGRPKTSYFAGKDVANSISEETSTGIFIGNVERISGNKIWLFSKFELQEKFRLRFLSENQNEPAYLVLKQIEKDGSYYLIDRENVKVQPGDRVFLVKLQDQKYTGKLEMAEIGKNPEPPATFKNKIRQSIFSSGKKGDQKLYFRIASEAWFPRINFHELDGLILNFTIPQWKKLDLSQQFFKECPEKIIVEFPKFISEKSLAFYRDLAGNLHQAGMQNFVLSHLSQKKLVPENCSIYSNENVYVFNDAAAALLKSERVKNFIFPQEMDLQTLETVSHKNGIVPLYFYPELFYSRMPIELADETFSISDGSVKLRRSRKNGITIIVPDRPVSVMQHKNKLDKLGFSSYLIDVSYEPFSKNRLKTLKTRFLKSEQVQPSTSFNFTKGLQ